MSNNRYSSGQEVSTGDITLKVIRPGIHDNISLMAVEFAAMKEGGESVLLFHFEDGDENTLRFPLWAVDESRTIAGNQANPRPHNRDNKVHGYVKGATVTDAEAVDIAYENFNKWAKHVATKFMTEEEYDFGAAASYDDWAKKYVALFTPERLEAGNPVRIKVVLNWEEKYSTMPKYPPFMESMAIVPRDQSKLRIEKWESVVASNSAAANADPTAFDYGANVVDDAVTADF